MPIGSAGRRFPQPSMPKTLTCKHSAHILENMGANLSSAKHHKELGGLTNRQYMLTAMQTYECEMTGAMLRQARLLGTVALALQAGGISPEDWQHIQRLARQGHPVWSRFIPDLAQSVSQYAESASILIEDGTSDLEGQPLIDEGRKRLATVETGTYVPLADLNPQQQQVVAQNVNVIIRNVWSGSATDPDDVVDAEVVA